jgi:hypothetical protein
MRLLYLPGVAVLGAVLASTVQAQSIDPATFSGSMSVGESVTIHKTITLAPGGADLVDLYMLADNTGSIGGTIAQAKAGASAILGALPTNTWVGVGDYQGDCSEGGLAAGCREEVTTYYGFGEKAPLSGDLTAAQTGINGWAALYGGDYPEANFDALKDVADLTAWRSGSQRLVVWFGDAPSHTESTDMAGAIAALNAKGITVLAFNNTSAGSGLDGSYGGDSNQASTVAGATGGSLLNNFLSFTGTDFVNAVNGAIGSATSNLDLVFGTDFFSLYSGGLAFSFTCTDALGCMDVAGGESRTFDVTITALAAGTYDFTIGADGVAAREMDHIVVGGTGVPEPTTWALLAIGLVGLGFAGWRRKEQMGQFA